MLSGTATLKFMRFDEDFQVSDLDGTNNRIADSVDLLYVSTHGQSDISGYRVALRDADWAPCASGFGDAGPSVAIFDTCDLLNLRDPEWYKPWITSKVGHSLRLLLGFASAATVAQTTTKRGHDFAKSILSGMPIGPAWLDVVHHIGYSGMDLGIAVGFGANLSDAEWSLNRMTLKDLPARRTRSTPSVVIRACH
jgi:hypothetical protein